MFLDRINKINKYTKTKIYKISLFITINIEVKMKKIVIVGAGGHCKVVIDTIEEINKIENTYEILGILDDNKEIKNVLNYTILGEIESLKNFDKKVVYHIAIGNNEVREKVYKNNKSREFISIKHPSGVISKYAIIESGSFVGAGAIVSSEAHIGLGTIVNTGSIIEHETIIGEFSHLSYRVLIGANSKIKSKTFIDMGKIINRNTDM